MPEAHDRRMSDRFPEAGGSGEGGGIRADERRTTDPTALTIDRVLREIGLLSARFALQIKGLEELIDEKLKAVDREFSLIERQRIEQKVDTQKAVDAALTAQKESVKEQTAASEKAIDKSELSFLNQINQLSATFQTSITALTITINDLKERVSRGESRQVGTQEAHTTQREQQIDMRAIIALVLVAITVVIGIYAAKH